MVVLGRCLGGQIRCELVAVHRLPWEQQQQQQQQEQAWWIQLRGRLAESNRETQQSY